MTPYARKLAAQRLQETVEHLWGLYVKDRRNADVRNRLAEHYTPLVQEITQRFVKLYRLREPEAAIGDALLLLVLRIVPQYDVKKSFRPGPPTASAPRCSSAAAWRRSTARCLRTNLGGEKDWPAIESLLVRPTEPGSDVRFAELAAAIPARDGAMLWLRFYRHLSHRQIAFVFGLSYRTVANEICRAIGVLQELVNPPAAEPEEEEEGEPSQEPKE